MNRTRYSANRHDRVHEGLQQGTRTPYPRTEVSQRGPMSSTTNRTKRLPTPGNNRLTATSSPFQASETITQRRSAGTKPPFLPRVATLASNRQQQQQHQQQQHQHQQHQQQQQQQLDNHRINSNNHRISSTRTAANSDHAKLQMLHREKSPPFKLPIPKVSGASAFREVQEQQHLQNIRNRRDSSSSNSSSCSSLTSCYDVLGPSERLIREGNHSFVYLCEPVLKLSPKAATVQAIPDAAASAAAAAAAAAAATAAAAAAGATTLTLGTSATAAPATTSQPDSISLESRLQGVRQQELQLQQLATQLREGKALKLGDDLMKDTLLEPYQTLSEDAGSFVGVGEDEDDEELLAQRPDGVELVCQNIPTLQREIRLLQQLGEQLEVTLRANLISSSTSTEPSTGYHTPRSGYLNMPLPIVHLGWLRFDHVPWTWQRGQLKHRRLCIGLVQEFRIETKTLTELKTGDETQSFYLPLAEGGGLARTSFRQLRENPNVLLRQLRPLSPSVSFNLLEQDAMFFNSILDLHIPRTEEECLGSLQPRVSGGGAIATTDAADKADDNTATAGPLTLGSFLLSSPRIKDALVDWLIPSEHKSVHATVQCELPVEQPREINSSKSHLRSHSQTTLRWKRPKSNPSVGLFRSQRSVASTRPVGPLKPLPQELETQVQTQLLKTVLVGIVQVAVFLVLIMAFTYPDVRC